MIGFDKAAPASAMKEAHPQMHSIRTKFALTVVGLIMITLGIATGIGVISIRNLGRDDADQMLIVVLTVEGQRLCDY